MIHTYLSNIASFAIRLQLMEKKVTELEIRYTQQEDSLQQISDIVATQQDEIARLKLELQELRGQLLKALPDDDDASDDLPPHY